MKRLRRLQQTPLDFAEPEAYAEEVEFPGEGTEDTPAETLLEPMETEAAQEPATFSPEPPEAMWAAPTEQPADESVETGYETEPATFETEYSSGTEPDAFDAEPETTPPEPEQPVEPPTPLEAFNGNWRR